MWDFMNAPPLPWASEGADSDAPSDAHESGSVTPGGEDLRTSGNLASLGPFCSSTGGRRSPSWESLATPRDSSKGSCGNCSPLRYIPQLPRQDTYSYCSLQEERQGLFTILAGDRHTVTNSAAQEHEFRDGEPSTGTRSTPPMQNYTHIKSKSQKFQHIFENVGMKSSKGS